jgi:Protein of unknown function (DUF3172)
MKRKSRSAGSSYRSNPASDASSSRSSGATSSAFNYSSLAILGGVFVIGIGIGVAFSSVANTGQGNVATREQIDASAPNPELCAQYGAAAMVTDARIYVTLNPFNVYVSRPKMQPGCILRNTNWSILEQRKLVTSEQVRECRNSMNTFGFTGSLETSPQVNCVYQNDGADNQFLNRPGAGGGGVNPENDKF